MNNQYGTLYLVATPIGNLEDITFRALRILKEVHLIAAEDTRHTIKLLNHFEIKQKMWCYHKYNEREQSEKLLVLLRDGKNIALVSDAGMPGISDPGNYLVTQAIEAGIPIIPVPGPSAVITALSASGMDTSTFMFVGFIPRKKQEQIAYLKEIMYFRGTIVIYEAPNRVLQTLKNIKTVFGNRKVVLARELTKIHEQFIRGDLDRLIEEFSKNSIIGECTLLIAGSEQIRQSSTNFDLEEALVGLHSQGGTLKSGIKTIAEKAGIPTKEVYRLYLERKNKKE